MLQRNKVQLKLLDSLVTKSERRKTKIRKRKKEIKSCQEKAY